MELTVVPIVKPEAANFIFGQAHFIKTVEDLHEALMGAVPGIRFGLAFCEASGKRARRDGGTSMPRALAVLRLITDRLDRRFHRHVGRFLALENAVDIAGCTPIVQIRRPCSAERRS
jgi:hypothetical protein